MTEFPLEDITSPIGLAGDSPILGAEGGFRGWESTKLKLMEFAQLPNAYQLLDSIFEINDHKVARTTLNEWSEGVFSQLPKVSILSDVEMGGALGGYSSELTTIFLSDSVNRHDIITGQVLLEEYGHHLDSLINQGGDTKGDEGQLFAATVLHSMLSQEMLSTISDENDEFVLTLTTGDRYLVEASRPVVRFFEHANYAGRSKAFGIGDYAYIGNDFNDIATSISIPSGQNLVVEVYEHANFQGRSTVLSYSQASIGADWNDPNWRTSHMNDSVSSLRVRQQRSDEIILYQHSNFQGLAHSDSTGSRRTVRFNDDYSSIDLPSNTRIDVYEEVHFKGAKLSFGGDVSFVGALNDKISSFQAYRSNTPEVIIAIYDRAWSQVNASRKRVSDALGIYGALSGNRDVKAIATLVGLQPQSLIDNFKRDPVGGSLAIAALIPGHFGLFTKIVGLYNTVVSAIVSPIVTLSLENVKKRNVILNEINGWK